MSRRIPARAPPALCALLAAAVGPLAGATLPESPQEVFGFTGLEIFKAEDASRLACVDVTGDGRLDVVVVNNRRATIDFFIQKSPAEIASSSAQPVQYDNINEILSDARFRKESYVTEKRVFDLLVEDLNGDGSPDLVYYGDPKELIVVLRDGARWSEERQRFPVTEGRPSSRGLGAGDLNGDGKTDIVLLGTEKTYIFHQTDGGKLGEPTELPNSEKSFSGLAVADLNGDARPDLLLLAPGQREPFRLRLQGPSGLGPEVAIETASFRSIRVADVTGDGVPEITVVQDATGRLVILQLETVAPEGAVGLTKARVYPLASTSDLSVGRLICGDVDGDSRTDVLEPIPKAAQLRLHRQGKDGELAVTAPFPTLAGLSGVAAGDVDGDGGLDVVVYSGEERAVGVTRWDGSRLSFPRSIPLEGKPLACDLVDLDGDGGEEIAVAIATKGDPVVRFIRSSSLSPSGSFSPEAEGLRLEDAKDPPERIAFFDANQDGVQDLLVFFPYDPPRVYIGGSGNSGADQGALSFVDVSGGKDFGRGLLQGTLSGSLASADVDGDGKPEFLLVKKNFARAFRVTKENVLEVVDQFNSRDPSSTILGVAAADWDGDGRTEVALLDKTGDRVWFLRRREAGPYEVAHEIRIPAFAYKGLDVQDLDGDGKGDLFVAGEDRFGVLLGRGKDFRFKAIAEYECELEDAWLDQVSVGDLNSDGRLDLLASEISFNLFEILVRHREGETVERRARFQIFESSEQRSESVESRRSREPREIAIADVTADGKADVVFLIHDRVIIYPQE